MPRTDRASRVMAAPPERVWAALVDPEALLAWLHPGGMTGSFERFDARPGGTYRMVLTYSDASGAPGKASVDSDIVEARFVDIVPGERVVQAVDFVSDDPAYAGTMTMTWEVTAVDAGTRVDIVARGVIKACLELGKDPAETIAIFRIPCAWEEEGFKILSRYGVEYCDRSVSMWEAARRAVVKIQEAAAPATAADGGTAA